MTKSSGFLGALPVCVGSVAVSKTTGKVSPLRCKQWSCPTCAKLNALTLAVRVVEGVRLYQSAPTPLSFITVTAWGRYTRNPALAYDELPKWWGKVHDKLRYRAKKQGRKLEFCAFIEEQSRGVPHLHAVATITLSTHDLKDMAVSSGFAHQAKSVPVRTKSVGWYVAKYLTKSGAKGTKLSNAPSGHRRVRFSTGWPPLPEPPPNNDLVVKRHDESYAAWAMRAQSEGVSLSMATLIARVQILLRAENWELTMREIDQLASIS